jgi:hypothetical protein
VWLTGWDEVNYHTLADFLVEQQKVLTRVLAALSQEGLITLEQVMQDGTKIKAQASARTYCQEETIHQRPERARRRVARSAIPGTRRAAKCRHRPVQCCALTPGKSQSDIKAGSRFYRC